MDDEIPRAELVLQALAAGFSQAEIDAAPHYELLMMVRAADAEYPTGGGHVLL